MSAIAAKRAATSERGVSLPAPSAARWAALVIVALLLVMPFVWMVSTSLKATGKEFTLQPELIPNPLLWGNYAEIFRLVPFLQWFWNSTVIVILTMTGRVVTASLAG